MLTSSRTSQRRRSPSRSDSHQSHSMDHCNVSLETLVSHLLASKSSLSSIKSVWRAKEIVISARESLEECAVLIARTNFLQIEMTGQISTLQTIRAKVINVYDDGENDFENILQSLDSANESLEETMGLLRSTMVETVFRPENEEPTRLLDFVDEQGVETMRDALKENIREAKAAQTDFGSAILCFDDDLCQLKASMTSLATSRSTSAQNSMVPDHLQSLESHAQQMADLLESLVQHFDLCVTAIRNTEGGTAAVRKAASTQPPGVEVVSVSGVMSPDEVISDEEMYEILDVLEKDAAQVEDVVMELHGLLANMETKLQVIVNFVSSLNKTYRNSMEACQLIEVIGLRLRGYIFASHDFNIRWNETKANILSQLGELESVKLFYENYYNSYDALVIEVHRRKQCQEQIHAILNKTMDELNRVYEADLREREEFNTDVGEFLPIDLWPGIGDAVPRWKYVRVDGEDEPDLPSISAEVVERAVKRTAQRATSQCRPN